MNKYFCNCEQSLALKELGFNEECIGTFDEDKVFDLQDFSQDYDTLPSHMVLAPLKSQAFEFFRDKYKMEGYPVCIQFNSKRRKGYQYVIISNNYSSFEQIGNFDTYEEAESACIDKLIEIVKNEKSKRRT